MADDTHPQGTTTSLRTGRCSWHDGITRDLRLIQIHEAGSGPGTAAQRYACHPCQIRYGLVPLADR
jgi:hypothetical protein